MKDNCFWIPTFCGQCFAKIKVLNVLPEISWIVADVWAGLEDEFKILEVKKLPKRNWLGISMELNLQCKQDHIDQLPDLIDPPDGTHHPVFVGG